MSEPASLVRTLALAAAPREVVAQVGEAFARGGELEVVVDGSTSFTARLRDGAEVRGQVRPAPSGSVLLLSYTGQRLDRLVPRFLVVFPVAVWVALQMMVGSSATALIGLLVLAALAPVGAAGTWLRGERRREHDFARVVAAVAQAVRPMLPGGQGQPYRALAAESAASVALAAPRPVWESTVPAPAEAVLARLGEVIERPGCAVVAATRTGFEVMLTREDTGPRAVRVEVLRREDGCAVLVVPAASGDAPDPRLERAALVLAGLFGLMIFVVPTLEASAVMAALMSAAGLIALTLADARRWPRDDTAELTAQIERGLRGLPAPAGHVQGDMSRREDEGARGSDV